VDVVGLLHREPGCWLGAQMKKALEILSGAVRALPLPRFARVVVVRRPRAAARQLHQIRGAVEPELHLRRDVRSYRRLPGLPGLRQTPWGSIGRFLPVRFDNVCRFLDYRNGL
jgi:hypothetical protein